jgi:hypothetical protein
MMNVVQQSLSRLSITASAAAVLCLAATSLPVQAESMEYVLDIKNRVPASYSLEIPVQYPGTLSVEADWDCSRILTFKLSSPGSRPHRIRRSGPSPQILELAVKESDLAAGRYYRLDISSLPAGGEGRGRLRIHLPDSPKVVQQKILASLPPEPEIPEPEWWAVPASPPAESSQALTDLFQEVEAFRNMVVTGPVETAPDPCRWQTMLLKHLAELRNRLAEGGPMPDEATVRFYRKLAASVGKVMDLRDSDDPILTGPPPKNRRSRNVWLRVRRERIKAIEHELDILLDMPKDGYVPELEDHEWPPRLVSCIMACERNFEELGRSGTEMGTNQELADETWPFIVAAAKALSAVDRLAVPARIRLN